MDVVIAVLSATGGGCLLGWMLRGRHEARRLAERIEHDIQKRRNALADRGRTTERRPEHDGLPPSRNARVRITSRPVTPGDQPQRKM